MITTEVSQMAYMHLYESIKDNVFDFFPYKSLLITLSLLKGKILTFLFKGALGPPPAAAPVAVPST